MWIDSVGADLIGGSRAGGSKVYGGGCVDSVGWERCVSDVVWGWVGLE